MLNGTKREKRNKKKGKGGDQEMKRKGDNYNYYNTSVMYMIASIGNNTYHSISWGLLVITHTILFHMVYW